VGITAYGSLVDLGKIEEGQSVFINGGTTGVGTLAIQIAKAKGCKVTVSTSGKNVKKVKELGADEVIDYTQSPPHIYFVSNPPSAPFNLILDTIWDQPDLFLNSGKYLAPSGVFISVGAAIPSFSELPWLFWKNFQVVALPAFLGGVNRKFLHYGLGSTGWKNVLEALNVLLAEGKVKPVVDSVYSFDDALEAYDRVTSLRAVGKVIVKGPTTE